MKMVKVVVFVPETHADIVRQAVGDAGAGKIGNYSHCSFSSKGKGRFLPMSGANPTIGQIGKVEVVNEERIEFICEKTDLEKVIEAMKKVHPYEEVAFDVYPLL
ncbi:MAG: hypothetical protein A2734_01475 [Parcubacteria group bacterium RIFCSPHIGHO2_01_FULL_40_30]|nr:MAG: hypothetical protein A2734_01475 [Parcubacteria group bacterium RIFCSPHIGHO2_01_FULL_40_30]OHB19452.1 MAG: hypothetical protein A3D40_00735 [Parcubacteria group bacterium RIFCSPHIGHO2_02_FULL_40_12]OHB23529.1 MAG: hypothetical protein A3I22_01555 [Parcubacteria group bacterium RIFCSPLOWO2_02_FULL_40_12]OHB23934.1 MAG: hypothetical protein A3F96_01760 [Parcubacteria group bacterium RIFCSPLOWO2_12_FULL_40_10]